MAIYRREVHLYMKDMTTVNFSHHAMFCVSCIDLFTLPTNHQYVYMMLEKLLCECSISISWCQPVLEMIIIENKERCGSWHSYT